MLYVIILLYVNYMLMSEISKPVRGEHNVNLKKKSKEMSYRSPERYDQFTEVEYKSNLV